MNTHEELRIAFDEFRKGTFIKHGTWYCDGLDFLDHLWSL